MTAKWIDGLLRARQFTEDNAKTELATAQRHLRRTRAQLRFDAERLEAMNYPGAEAHAASFVASAVALQAAAATHAAARAAAAEADLQAGVRRHELVDAAVSRRSAEELAERALAAERAKESAAAQRATDEIAAAVFRRSHAKELAWDDEGAS